MRSARWLAGAALAVALSLAACGGGSPTGSDNNGNNGSGTCTSKYAATVNGSSWCALSVLANYYANQQQIVITGVGFAGGNTSNSWSLTLSVSSITAAGTYALTSTAPLRYAIAGSSSGTGYATTGAGGTGTITFTTYSTTHVVGTYSFTAPANTGGSGTVVVTNGSFDVPVTPGS